ncbi:MAG: hypothetical protein CME84_08985 [Henriciella sp.]|jgi:hypothetical protein|nr:hypothetical protein [Henriciella sp.]
MYPVAIQVLHHQGWLCPEPVDQLTLAPHLTRNAKPIYDLMDLADMRFARVLARFAGNAENKARNALRFPEFIPARGEFLRCTDDSTSFWICIRTARASDKANLATIDKEIDSLLGLTA